MFFVKGIIETIKKLNWKPDVIQLDNWFSFLFALYRRKIFNNDNILKKSKIILTFSNDDIFKGSLSKDIFNKLAMDGIVGDDIDILKKPTYHGLFTMALSNSDGVVKIGKSIDSKINNIINDSKIPSISLSDSADLTDEDMEFYSMIANDE